MLEQNLDKNIIMKITGVTETKLDEIMKLSKAS